MPDICDYEGSDYKQRFWTPDRRYEDLVERAALRALLPPTGGAIADCGAGFGRLADLYTGYSTVILVDYSRSMLQQARERHGDDPRFLFLATDIRKLPLASDSLDAIVTIRVLHHLREIAPAIAEAARVVAPGGAYLLEFASKRHLKSIARYLLHRQPWSPFSRQPVEFVELNLDFHPAHIAEELAAVGLTIERTRALSLFRSPRLKRAIPPRLLAALDAALQPFSSLYPLTPSVLVRSRAPHTPRAARADHLLACPECHARLTLADDTAACAACGLLWQRVAGVYDFKSPPQPL